MNAMTAEFVVQGHSLGISCSLGISIFPEHGADGETLIKNADAAMYCAKENGRNNFRFFTEDMNAQAVERLTLENSLRLALDKKELFLVYQPQMDIATGRITGLEALLRWQHPELGLVPPDKFIRIAENSGLIVPNWRMGAQDSLLSGPEMARRRSSRRFSSSKCISGPVSSRGLLRTHQKSARRDWPRPAIPRTGTHRKPLASQCRRDALSSSGIKGHGVDTSD
jgi:predicted signal transduction protein with EAL and GGDEF domain